MTMPIKSCRICAAALAPTSRSRCCSDECRRSRENECARRKQAGNFDANRAKYRSWYAANPEKVRAYKAARSVSHDREYQRRYYQEHKEIWRERQRLRTMSGKSREAHNRWLKNNRDKEQLRGRVKQNTRRALTRGQFVEVVDPMEVHSRANGMCGICRKPVDRGEKWHVDHIDPISKGGAHTYDNVQLAHAKCNMSKGAKVPKGQGLLFRRAS